MDETVKGVLFIAAVVVIGLVVNLTIATYVMQHPDKFRWIFGAIK